MKSKRILILLLAALFVCSTAALHACAGDGGSDITTASQQQNESGENASDDEISADAYIFPEIEGGGREFKFYNVPVNVWGYYTDLAFEETPGEALDDAVYRRNRFIEDKFNISITEINMPGTDMWTYNSDLRRLLTAGEDIYDAIFMPVSFNGTIGTMITENLFHDMREIPTLNIEREWWNQTMLRDAAIGTGNSIFYTGSSINLFTLQSGGYIFFNQDMMQDIGQPLPYDIVREGKWTFDVFQQYIRAGTSLNGAVDFTWEPGGSAVYGQVGYGFTPVALLAGAGEQFITLDDGMPVFAPGERFIRVLTGISEILDISNGNYIPGIDWTHNIQHYEVMFRSSRAMFTVAELKSANQFRDMDATFGILPMPKFDEAQQEYMTRLINSTLVLVIPHTNDRTEFTGAVLDALAYLSHRDITPVLFDIAVSHKQLRNEESIEMLEFTKNKGSFDIGVAYGWTNEFSDIIATTIGEGKPMDIVSQIERLSGRINADIAQTIDRFN